MKLLRPDEHEEGHTSTSKSWNTKYKTYQQEKTKASGG